LKCPPTNPLMDTAGQLLGDETRLTAETVTAGS
jgi:hypothetical protein